MATNEQNEDTQNNVNSQVSWSTQEPEPHNSQLVASNQELQNQTPNQKVDQIC